jgi:hypothetical protein
MPTTITLSNVISGASPFDVYICLSGGSPCYYITSIDSGDLPYDFTVPSPIEKFTYYCMKVVDSDGCVITGCTSI